MNTPNQPNRELRQALLDQIASITTMRPGTLAEEYREHPSSDGRGTVRLGPYFKYQVWQDGRNRSRRVSADEATTLKHDIEEAKRFKQLTDQLAQLNIQNTIALRAGETTGDAAIAEKKTSKPSALRKNTAKRKPSSSKPAKKSPRRRNSTT